MQLLKKALEEADWEKVSQAYEILTGDYINPPQMLSATLEHTIPSIDSVITDLETVRDRNTLDFYGNEIIPIKPAVKKKRGRPKGSKTKKNTITKIGNREMETQEVDTGKRKMKFVTGEILTAQETAEKIMYKPPVERRNTYTGITTTCNKCGKTFEGVNPQFIKPDPDVKGGTYTCNGCQSRR